MENDINEAGVAAALYSLTQIQKQVCDVARNWMHICCCVYIEG